MGDAVRVVIIAATIAIVTLAAMNLMATRSDNDLLSLSPAEQDLVLQMARNRLRQSATGEPEPAITADTLTPALQQDAACFVTLTENGALRGCILDSFDAHEPLYENVLRNVVLAATRDTRFSPVRPSEVDLITIEISVLDRPRPLHFSSPEDLVARLVPGTDGVILHTRYGTSTYLPQVWDVLPDPAEFLSSLCEKQGAPADCWRNDPKIEVETYRVFHFSEESLHKSE
jgi:AmmeMemoRadiSam system protein A